MTLKVVELDAESSRSAPHTSHIPPRSSSLQVEGDFCTLEGVAFDAEPSRSAADGAKGHHGLSLLRARDVLVQEWQVWTCGVWKQDCAGPLRSATKGRHRMSLLMARDVFVQDWQAWRCEVVEAGWDRGGKCGGAG
eukprot:352286-Chlamydomonas_euryale.AAC.2